MLAARPTQMVETGAFMCCIVSYIAKPAVTELPGELMYKEISLSDPRPAEQELGYNQVCHTVVNRGSDKDDPVLQEP